MDVDDDQSGGLRAHGILSESAVDLKKRKRISSENGKEADDVLLPPSSSAMDGIISAESPSHLTAWQHTISKAIQAIVSIRFSQVSSFDTEGAETSEATGFVVDAERGLILTNRHVACAGPFVGEAIFHDHEEVDVFPVYRDPVHDFGILKFDPKKIRFMTVSDIPLAPHLAKVGLEIRVVGNDAGEKLSILAGSISRLDRNAPDYGELTFNDFNTFYIQAASSTSGGSSGSPVLDINGNAVALQAGGHVKAATDFFFPLDRVKRALGYIQMGIEVPRGTIQTQFFYRPFDEVRRLGLKESTEAIIRATIPDEIGMLVCETVVPQGPASEFLEEGDVLISINGVVVTKFVPMEETWDDRCGVILLHLCKVTPNSVGRQVTLKVERGGEPLEFQMTVQDLHSITPDRYLQVGGAKVNNLSYQLARQFCVPVTGVYVSEPSGMFRLDGSDHGWIISSIDNHPTDNLDAFIEAVKRLPDRERIPITYYSIADVHTTNVAIVSVERHWTSFRLAVRNDKTGLWDFTDLGPPLPPRPILPSNATFAQLDESLGPAKVLFQSVVKVSYFMPCRLDGYPKSRKQGAGLVLDAQMGLVVVGRNIVPFNMGDVSLTFADSIIIPGKVVFLHPTHNVAFIKYDPTLVGETPVRTPVISETELVQDAITLDTPLAQQCSSGVLADSSGQVKGLWLSFLGERTSSGHDNEYYLGVSSRVFRNVLAKLRRGETPNLRGFTVELMPVQISQARHMGLTDPWVRKVEAANPHRRQLFMVRRIEAGGENSNVLKELDLILSVGDKVVTRIHEMDVSEEWGESVKIKVLRQKQEMDLVVPTEAMDGEGTSRIVIWAGAVMQEPHRAVLQQSKTLPSRVYVSARTKGSPSYMYGLVPTTWVTHINGVPTPTLDDFLQAVKNLPDNEYVRVKTISFDLVPCVLSIKNTLHYWPTSENAPAFVHVGGNGPASRVGVCKVEFEPHFAVVRDTPHLTSRIEFCDAVTAVVSPPSSIPHLRHPSIRRSIMGDRYDHRGYDRSYNQQQQGYDRSYDHHTGYSDSQGHYYQDGYGNQQQQQQQQQAYGNGDTYNRGYDNYGYDQGGYDSQAGGYGSQAGYNNQGGYYNEQPAALPNYDHKTAVPNLRADVKDPNARPNHDSKTDLISNSQGDRPNFEDDHNWQDLDSRHIKKKKFSNTCKIITAVVSVLVAIVLGVFGYFYWPRLPSISVMSITASAVNDSAYKFTFPTPGNLNNMQMQLFLTMNVSCKNDNLYDLKVASIDLNVIRLFILTIVITMKLIINLKAVLNVNNTIIQAIGTAPSAITPYVGPFKSPGNCVPNATPRIGNGSYTGAPLVFPAKTNITFTMAFTLSYSPDACLGLLKDPVFLELMNTCGLMQGARYAKAPLQIGYQSITTIHFLEKFGYKPTMGGNIQIKCPATDDQLTALISASETNPNMSAQEILETVFSGKPVVVAASPSG
ncbi:hypothetical protein HK101_004232 [Irineochytrium annulatum]|nr:hypothetical protein HK101_004232 [Irineochytrium annulatum]